jgi:hypothetical protein
MAIGLDHAGLTRRMVKWEDEVYYQSLFINVAEGMT